MSYLQGYDDDMGECLEAIRKERFRQEDLKAKGKFKYSCADQEMTHAERLSVLMEEVGEASHEVNEMIGKDREYAGSKRKELWDELVQVAAVATAWLEAIHRANGRRVPK